MINLKNNSMVIRRDKLKQFNFHVNKFLSQSLFRRGRVNLQSEDVRQNTLATIPTGRATLQGNFVRPDVIKTQAGKEFIKTIKNTKQERFQHTHILSLGFLTTTSAFSLYKRYGIPNYTLFSTNAEEDIMLRDLVVKGVKGNFNNKNNICQYRNGF